MRPTVIDAAHISSFPTEILQAIFSFDQDAVRYELRPKSRYPQLRLAHVCSAWRSAAFGIPSLWNKIHVSLQCHPSAASANGHALWSWWDALNTFLSFAKNFPLMVEIVWYSGAEAVSEVRNISVVLFRTSPRWKAASLSFRSEIDWSFLDPLHAKLPLLEDLSFDVNEGAWGVPIATRPCHAFSVVPSLRSVSLESTNGGLPRLEIPWHQITRLSTRLPKRGAAEISRFICNGVVAIGSSGELKELSIRDPLRSCPSLPSSIMIPSLTRLSFEGGIHVVGSLILPALRELTVWDDMLRGSNKGILVVDVVRELICRSECTITVLSIQGCVPLTAQPLADLAVHLHAVTNLSIHSSDFYSESSDMFAIVLALLTPAPSSLDSGERNIFPLLEHLTLIREHSLVSLDDFPLSGASADALCDMLELRYPSHSAPPRLFTHATIFPGARPPLLQPNLIKEFKRGAGWARITRVYQGQLDVSIQVLMSHHSWYKSDFEMWLGRTDGGRSPYI